MEIGGLLEVHILAIVDAGLLQKKSHMTQTSELKFPKNVPITHYGLDWIQAAINRAAVAYHRHGGKTAHFRGKGMSALDHALQRAKWYRKTGNQEWLVDTLNFIIRELQIPSHPKVHWNKTARHPEASIWRKTGERE